MNRLSPDVLLAVFFLMLTGIFGVYIYKQRTRQPAVAARPLPPPLQAVVVASTDLPAGLALSNSDFMVLRLSQTQLANKNWPGIMLADGRQLVGRVLKVPIKQGQPFEPSSFYTEGMGPDVTERLSPGLRAVTLSVSATGLPHQAVPGNSVDVVSRSTLSKDATIPELTQTLVSGVEILSIGDNSLKGRRSTINSKREDQAVTLAVTADQAVRLKVAEGHGEMSLILRNPGEPGAGQETSAGLSLADVLDLPPPAAPPSPPPAVTPPPVEPKAFVSEVYRRGRKQVLSFSADGSSAPETVPVEPALPETGTTQNRPGGTPDGSHSSDSPDRSSRTPGTPGAKLPPARTLQDRDKMTPVVRPELPSRSRNANTPYRERFVSNGIR